MVPRLEMGALQPCLHMRLPAGGDPGFRRPRRRRAAVPAAAGAAGPAGRGGLPAAAGGGGGRRPPDVRVPAGEVPQKGRGRGAGALRPRLPRQRPLGTQPAPQLLLRGEHVVGFLRFRRSSHWLLAELDNMGASVFVDAVLGASGLPRRDRDAVEQQVPRVRRVPAARQPLRPLASQEGRQGALTTLGLSRLDLPLLSGVCG
mmetsp:Transcript_86995/g.226988  ORF Transcript_86995/g.226988 Transcript_86995/m.226988 type:complete len:202 (+) Transcript_86995:145-750(+)